MCGWWLKKERDKHESVLKLAMRQDARLSRVDQQSTEWWRDGYVTVSAWLPARPTAARQWCLYETLTMSAGDHGYVRQHRASTLDLQPTTTSFGTQLARLTSSCIIYHCCALVPMALIICSVWLSRLCVHGKINSCSSWMDFSLLSLWDHACLYDAA